MAVRNKKARDPHKRKQKKTEKMDKKKKEAGVGGFGGNNQKDVE